MAKLKEVLSIQAENELEDAFYFYNLISAKVGDEFLNQINSCIQSILLYPESFPIEFETYRKAVVKNHPFVIIYTKIDAIILLLPFFTPAKIQRKNLDN